MTHFCSNTLGEHWIKRIIHPIRLKCIKGKVKSVREEFRRLKRVGAPRRNERWKTDLTNFTSEKNKLFDVFCEDKNERKKLETIHGIPMEEKEYKFLEAMRTNRTGAVCKGIDTVWHKKREEEEAKIRRRIDRQHEVMSSASQSIAEEENDVKLVQANNDSDEEFVQEEPPQTCSNWKSQAKIFYRYPHRCHTFPGQNSWYASRSLV